MKKDNDGIVCENCLTRFTVLSKHWPRCPECNTSAERDYVVSFTVKNQIADDWNGEYKFTAFYAVETNEIRRYIADAFKIPYSKVYIYSIDLDELG